MRGLTSILRHPPYFRSLAVGFVIGAGVGAGGCYIYFKSQAPRHAAAADTIWPAADPIRSKAASEFGIPLTESIRVFDGYVASYDFRTRNPKWVVEHITSKTLDGEANRTKSEFFEDPQIEPSFRASLKITGTLAMIEAPAADHKNSQKAMDETFSLTNISPQVGKGFNRDYWSRFERCIRELARKVDDVYVVTGPLWMPRPDGDGKWVMQHPMIGEPPGLVSVPTHYYKVVVADGRGAKGDKRVGVGAFVMPNAPIDDRIPLSAFTVPLEPLEQLAGIRFFPGYISAERREMVNEAAHVWRHHGLQQLKPFDRVTLGQDMAALPALPAPPGSTPQLLLPAPGAAVGGSAPSSSALSAPEPVKALPKTRGAAGAVHLCELNACKLPPPWQGGSNGNGNGNGGGGGSRGGGGRQGSGGRGRLRG